MRILVTPRSLTRRGLAGVAELDPLRDQGWELISGPAGRSPSETELCELLPGVDGWLCGIEKVPSAVFAVADRLRVISRNGVGIDNLDLDAARAHGVRVVAARGANTEGVAELAIGLMLASLRHLPQASADLHAGRWARTLGRELADCTVGVVGYGAIGRTVAAVVTGFGADVLAYDPFAAVVPPARPVGLEELFAASDVITLHSPATSDGAPLVTSGLLHVAADGLVLVNTARASLVDESAALQALQTGRISSYCVDAYHDEPPRMTPLLSHAHTILTPHIGGYTTESTQRAASAAATNLVEALRRPA